MQRKSLILVLVLYIISSVVSYGAFSFMGGSVDMGSGMIGNKEVEPTASPLSYLLDIDPSEPVDQPCPLNGKLFTKTEKEAWEQRRPLFVMIENSPDARPQSGLSRADVVFEAIAEGGVTRFMGGFYCDVQKEDTTLAPIRSARSYFVDYASGFNLPMYVHVGGANLPGPADALGQISDYGWNGENDMNQFSIGYPTFVRNYDRVPGKELAAEHTMETSTEKLWEVAEEREWTNITPERRVGRTTIEAADWQDEYEGWTFQKSAPAAGDVTDISFEFWTGFEQYAVRWEYNPTTNSYKRSLAGAPHIDMNNDEQIEASTAIVLLTDETGPIDEKKHMLYETTGTGDALVFMNGNVVEATWSKKNREAELTFTDAKGKDLELAPGLIWISVVDTSTEVSY